MLGVGEGRLRNMKAEDLDFIFRWRNSERIRNSMLTDHIISPEEHYNWFKQLHNKPSVYLVFEFRNCPAGLVYFTDMDEHNNICKWGFYLGETDLPPKTGLLMGYLGLNYVFEVVGIRKLCSEVLARNKVSIRYHMRLGFYQEGYLAKHIKKDNQYKDLVWLALFKDSWELTRHKVELLLECSFSRGDCNGE